MAAGDGEAAQDVGGLHRLHAQPVAIGFEHGRHRAEERRPVLVLLARDSGQVGATEQRRGCATATRRGAGRCRRRPRSRASSESVGSIARSSASTGAGSNACSTAASISVSLSTKTRKIVPSATPAASAICRVVIWVPWAMSSGTVAARIDARRSSAGIAAARARDGPPFSPSEMTEELDGGAAKEPVYLSEHSLSQLGGRFFAPPAPGAQVTPTRRPYRSTRAPVPSIPSR